MSKHLTEKEKKEVVAKHTAGESVDFLAHKYGCSTRTIQRIVSKNGEFGDICQRKKKEQEEEILQSMGEFLRLRSEKAQAIIDTIISSFTRDDIMKASFRDRMGGLKIMAETFSEFNGDQNDEKEVPKIEFVIKDTSYKEGE